MRANAALLFAILLAGSAGPAAAQFVHGRVVDAATERGIEGATVSIRSDDGARIGRAVTDSAGRFLLQASRVGDFTIVAEREGLQPVSAALTVGLAEEVEVTLRMSSAVVALDPLTVSARAHINIGPLAGYYDRARRNQLAGIGNIITRDQIDERRPTDVTDLLRSMPRVRIGARMGRESEVRFSGARGGCIPKVYIDGLLMNRRDPAYVNEMVHPMDLEGIEVYQGLAQMPGEFHDLSGCGVLLMWTRRSSEDGRPFSWRRVAMAAGVMGLLLLLAR